MNIKAALVTLGIVILAVLVGILLFLIPKVIVSLFLIGCAVVIVFRLYVVVCEELE